LKKKLIFCDKKNNGYVKKNIEFESFGEKFDFATCTEPNLFNLEEFEIKLNSKIKFRAD
jgi:hypothetical protein